MIIFNFYKFNQLFHKKIIQSICYDTLVFFLCSAYHKYLGADTYFSGIKQVKKYNG